jgi:ankyrin repeat protein
MLSKAKKTENLVTNLRLVEELGALESFYSANNLDTSLMLIKDTKENNKLDIQVCISILGCDVNVKDSRGATPLLWATYLGHKDIAKLLIKNGADVTEVFNIDVIDGFKLDLTKNKKLTDKKWFGFYGSGKNQYDILHLAISKGDPDVIEPIIKAAADIIDHQRLNLACLVKNFNAVPVLLRYGVDPEKRDQCIKKSVVKVIEEYIKNPVEYILKNHEKLEHVKFALENLKNVKSFEESFGANIKETIKDHLNLACLVKDFNAVPVLLRSGFDPEKRDQCIEKSVVEVIEEYIKDPVEYILKNHEKLEHAKSALGNLKNVKSFEESFGANIEETIKCLKEFEIVFDDLDDSLLSICGNDSNYFTSKTV